MISHDKREEIMTMGHYIVYEEFDPYRVVGF